mgnify:CR=1 FL=1
MVEGMVPEETPTSEMAIWFSCEGDLLDRKVRALRAQQSQIEPLVTGYGIDAFRSLVREEFFREPVPPIRMSRAVSRRTLLPKDSSSAKRGTFGSDTVSDGPAVRALGGRPDILVAWTFT